MQSRLDKGEFNSATTRVLHFVANPESDARREQQAGQIAQLEAEIAALKLQASLVESGTGAGASGAVTTATAALEARAIIAEQKVLSQCPSCLV